MSQPLTDLEIPLNSPDIPEPLPLPDLQQLDEYGELVFLPWDVGDLRVWSQRMAPLGSAEFHLYDREQSPETEIRRQIVADINRRPNRRAVLTNKRSLENDVFDRECPISTE